MNAIDLNCALPVEGRIHSDEQVAILNEAPTSTMVVDAAAGSGKTTTLVDYACKWRSHKGLYLAFNRDIANHAQNRFPPWVRAQTTHSFAFKALGVSRFSDRLTGRIRRQHIRQAGFDLHSEYLPPDRMMRCVLQALTNFCNDGGDELKLEHCGLTGLHPDTRKSVLPRIAAIVKRFLDYENSGLPFTHDVYLKRLEMSGGLGDVADYIMIDEAQDSNGVTLSLARKSGKPVIYIGDPKQSIYGFRGAVNAMSLAEGKRFPLSMSWRFGQGVADLCNRVLSFSDDPCEVPIRGRPDRQTSIELYQGRAPARSFILARTNARLFEGLIAIPPGTPFFIAGGFDTLANQLLSAHALSRNEQHKVTDPYVRGFPYWEDMLEESADDDPDAKKLVKIIKEYGDEIPRIIDRLRAHQRPHHQDAQILLSTAHKAKGLEADNVVVLDDFATPKELRARRLESGLNKIDYEQELNLLYVALSRAKHRLMLAAPLYEFSQNKGRN